jgi:hypothetical protein
MGISTQTGLASVVDALHAHFEVGPGLIHLIDETKAWEVILLPLPPDRLALSLNPLAGVKNSDRAIQDPQRPFHLSGEVDVARGVDQIDFKALPGTLGCSGGDRNASALLLLQVVHDRRAIMNLTHLIGLARVVEDTLAHSGLAGINVGHDANIAYFL